MRFKAVVFLLFFTPLRAPAELSSDCESALSKVAGLSYLRSRINPTVDSSNPSVVHYPDGTTIEYKNSDPANPHGEENGGTISITHKGEKEPTDKNFFLRTDRGYQEILDQLYPKELVNLWNMRGGKRVLDLGTGTGRWVREMRAAGIDAYGLDLYLSPNQRKEGPFLMADIANTGLAANQFDIIYSNVSSFHWKANLRKTELVNQLQEIKRILKPGGVLRVSPIQREMMESLIQEVGGLTITRSPSPSWQGSYFLEIKKNSQ